MATAPRGSQISASTVTRGMSGSKPSEQSQKSNIRVVGFEPTQRVIGVRAKDFEGYRPRTGALYAGRLRAGATVSAP